jgi:hypothetical protein
MKRNRILLLIILLLLPFVLFAIGQDSGKFIYKEIAAIVFIAYILVGLLYGQDKVRGK